MNDIALKFIEETKVIFLESNAENCNKKKIERRFNLFACVCVCGYSDLLLEHDETNALCMHRNRSFIYYFHKYNVMPQSSCRCMTKI